MMAISQRLMAQELKVAERDLVILAQPGFHLDMAMRPLADGRILLNDHAASAALVEQVLAEGSSLSESERQALRQSVADLRQQSERWHKIHALIRQQLSDAGLTPIATPGVFSVGKRPVNWMNGIMGTRQQPFYITNAASIAPLNQAFAAWLQHEVTGLTPYFVGQAVSNKREEFNQAEALLRGSGGLGLHHPAPRVGQAPRTGWHRIRRVHSPTPGAREMMVAESRQDDSKGLLWEPFLIPVSVTLRTMPLLSRP
jgi:hypothetical protein